MGRWTQYDEVRGPSYVSCEGTESNARVMRRRTSIASLKA